MNPDAVSKTLLYLMRRNFGQQWSIRRIGRLWIATATSHRITHAPTLIEENIDVFVRQLESPPAGIGHPALVNERLTEKRSNASCAKDTCPEE
ncbi:hypothetical protein [Nocardiopsis salina]|uniref:hypothetical protein n=1 Tax=Nocardiopsis salina TaxID=245836 RepID=UPI000349D9DD|nr:hypothetical protein [Nocardiopsis salina]